MAANRQKSVLLRLIHETITLASWAGCEIRKVTEEARRSLYIVDTEARTRLGVVDKGRKDFQTKADRQVQRLITVHLANLFPECTIVGEEDLAEDKEADLTLTNLYKQALRDDRASVLKLILPDGHGYENLTEKDITIWIDPLDGTREFVEHLNVEHLTVLIGISAKGSAIAGIIHQPYLCDPGKFNLAHATKLNMSSVPTHRENFEGRTMWGLVGLGCFGIAPKKLTQISGLIVVTTKSHGNQDIDHTLDAIKPDCVMRIGGAGYKVLQVIEGEAHSYVFPSSGCKRWDTAAPEAILKASGGKLTNVFGNPIEYNYRPDNDYQNHLGVIASADEAIHSKIIKSIPAHVADRLLEFEKQHNLKSKC